MTSEQPFSGGVLSFCFTHPHIRSTLRGTVRERRVTLKIHVHDVAVADDSGEEEEDRKDLEDPVGADVGLRPHHKQNGG